MKYSNIIKMNKRKIKSVEKFAENQKTKNRKHQLRKILPLKQRKSVKFTLQTELGTLKQAF